MHHADRLSLSLAYWLIQPLTHRRTRTVTHRLIVSRRLAERLEAGGWKLLGEAACCETRRWLTEVPVRRLWRLPSVRRGTRGAGSHSHSPTDSPTQAGGQRIGRAPRVYAVSHAAEESDAAEEFSLCGKPLAVAVRSQGGRGARPQAAGGE